MTDPQLPPDIVAALDRAFVDDATLERIARHLEPKLWKMIDKYRDDDDWNGATSINARQTSLERTRQMLQSFKVLP
jgi:hypothetical protein